MCIFQHPLRYTDKRMYFLLPLSSMHSLQCYSGMSVEFSQTKVWTYWQQNQNYLFYISEYITALYKPIHFRIYNLDLLKKRDGQAFHAPFPIHFSVLPLEFLSVSYLKQVAQILYLSPLRLHSKQGPYPCLGTREKLSWCSQCHEHRELMTWHSSAESSIIKNQSSLPEELAPGKHNSLSLPQTW